MKIYLSIIAVLIFNVPICHSQNTDNYKERHFINLRGFKKTFKYEPKDSIPSMEETNVLYNSAGEKVSYNIIKKNIAKSSKELTTDILNSNGLQSKYWTNANINEKKGRVYIHPFKYEDNDLANNFFEKNYVYLELDDRQNYSFIYSAWQVGVVTIPIKWYLSNELGNVVTDINAMLSPGFKWGKTHFVKLPHEEKARQYQRNFSLNLLIGLSKLELDKSNTDKDDLEGNVAAISTGISFGIYYRDFAFLAASGFDFPTSNYDDWNFSGIPWIGIGFGYDFLKLAGDSN